MKDVVADEVAPLLTRPKDGRRDHRLRGLGNVIANKAARGGARGYRYGRDHRTAEGNVAPTDKALDGLGMCYRGRGLEGSMAVETVVASIEIPVNHAMTAAEARQQGTWRLRTVVLRRARQHSTARWRSPLTQQSSGVVDG